MCVYMCACACVCVDMSLPQWLCRDHGITYRSELASSTASPGIELRSLGLAAGAFTY